MKNEIHDSYNTKKVNFRIISHYVKNLHINNEEFSNFIFADTTTMDSNVDVSASAELIRESFYQITINVAVEVDSEKQESLYIMKLEYSILIEIINENELGNIDINYFLHTEATSYLYPFVVAFVASITKDTGYPSIIMNPINFYEKYNE